MVDLCLTGLAKIELRAFGAFVPNTEDGILQAPFALEAFMNESNRFGFVFLLVENLFF